MYKEGLKEAMKQYSNDFKEQVVREVSEVGNISLVCRKHNLKPSTVHGWLYANKNQEKIADKKVVKQLNKKVKVLS